MPSIINSDDGVVSGTSGLKTTGGNDGLLNIQSNGSTVVAVTGSGISVTGTVSQTGVSTFAAGTVSAPSITFTGDTNTGIFSPAADTIAFAEGGAEAMRIDSSGNVGIGTSSPLAPLDAVTNGSADGILLRGRSSDNISNISLTSNTAGTVYAQIQGRSTDLRIQTNSTNPMIFYTNATERMRINAGAPILCLSGGNTSATGTGIAFPATQSASSDANTLDDYEEGTWTPVLKFDTNTQTISIANNSYVKIGRTVTINMSISWNSKNGSGRVYITGLPFAKESGGTVGLIATCSASTISTTEALFYNVDSNNTILNLAGQSGDINSSSLAGAGIISCTGTYMV